MNISIDRDFPILTRSVYGKRLVYLDSAASTQKPKQVLDRMTQFYTQDYANIHRGVHFLSQRATEHFESARRSVARFINAPSEQEIIFVRGATEGINLIAHSFARAFLKAGDEVILTAMEHHSNIVPWQMMREEFGIVLKVLPVSARGELCLDELPKLFSERTKLLSVTHVSNALGTVNPIARIIASAHEHSVPVLVDGCQAVAHQMVDVQALDADFYVFSAHKMYGPTGIGVVYGRKRLLNLMPPYQGGGDMIVSVSFDKTEYADLPHRFEAGTPAIVEAIGLDAAIGYIRQIGFDAIAAHEDEILAYALQSLSALHYVRLIGTPTTRRGVISFVLDGIHPHDAGTILDRSGIAVRVGHHCAQPLMEQFDVPATIRASFGLYNTTKDVDALIVGLQHVYDLLGR
jgi:cysteine desulfurase/selenocysteine lyase